MNYDRILQFKGTWRTYQARALENAAKYLQDGKVHIVAAPGSGKTTLGIELIKRMQSPTLVLAPSITIREQWVARIVSGFLCEGVNAEDYISQDLRDPRVITVVTYQALHSALRREKCDGKGEEDEGIDYTDFDVIAMIRDNAIGVFCLDECHHLRSEWWKALEEVRSACTGIRMISLTATPPYDSTPSMWNRYIDMCGEIDVEISIPELVKEGSLCPHQDYVYFNYPTKEEQKLGDKELMKSKGKIQSIRDIVAHEHKSFGDELRLLILTDFIKKEYEKAVGDETKEAYELGVVPFFEILRRDIEERLRQPQGEEDSKGQEEAAKAESATSEQTEVENINVTVGQTDLSQVGVQQTKKLRLGVLCGTLVVIPAEAKTALEKAVEGVGKVTFSSIGQLAETDYLKVDAVGDAHFLTAAVTEIFTQGYMQVLVGTKSLLGEGWDSPCINSLILASFVGSFMLSNQMRGRAIRVFKDKPDKTSNIWHLVCINPSHYDSGAMRLLSTLQEDQQENDDMALLERRMEHFMGLHYTKETIESGMGRMSIIKPPYTPEHIAEMNAQMLALSAERDDLKERWQKALAIYKKPKLSKREEAEREQQAKKQEKEKKKKSKKRKKSFWKKAWKFFAGAAAVGYMLLKFFL